MLQAAAEQYRLQQAIATTATAAVRVLWMRMDADFDASWSSIAEPMLNVVQTARTAAVNRALGYTPAVLAETDQPDRPVGELVPARFVAATPDGRSVSSLLAESVISAKTAVSRGQTVDNALSQGGRFLQMATLTTLADTRREVYGADIVRRPNLTGYVRMLNPPSCSRCIILAGRWYRWNEGFLRHPRCDCQHVPAHEDIAGDLRTDPYAMFHSLSKAEQDATFGRIDARAIRDGADIYRVVNIQHRGLATAKGATRFGTPTRRTVDDIYRVAGTRTNAIKMLAQEGYITGPQVRGGNIIGTGSQAQGFGQLGKGGHGRAASNAVLDSNARGFRDPLNRYTMTAAERRLYDAHYRLAYAQRNGVVPRSIGASSADRNANIVLATPERLALLQRDYRLQLAKLSENSPKGMKELADALGIEVRPPAAVSPLAGGSGSSGSLPPRRGGPTLPPPDPSDRRAWDAYWARRQEALALDTGGDRLEPHEIQFLERFLPGNRVTWIPRDQDSFRPTNDFVWVNNGQLVMELKSIGAKYQSIRNKIHETVRRATMQGVIKENFIVDIGDAPLTAKLRRQLEKFNERTHTTPIARLFVMSRDGLEEIQLRRP